MAPRTAAGALLFAVLWTACSRAGPSTASLPAAASPTGGSYAQSKLALQAAADRVLVSLSGDPVLTVGDFNARLTIFPVSDIGQPVAAARREVLDQMINVIVIAREEARRSPEAAQPRERETARQRQERLSHMLIRTSVANPFLIGDAEARAYYATHQDQFPQLDRGKSSLSEEERMLYIKFTLLSRRFQEQVRQWRSRETVVVDDSLLDG
jgi:hypothetical protein